MSEAQEKTDALIEKGANIPHPASVCIDPSVDLDHMSPDITIYPGCRISGETTTIGPSCVIGEEQPATVDNCQLQERVSLKGGFFSETTFLYGSSIGSGAHVRPHCLLEEQASCAHTVGLKQTVLMPYVTLGSLINFCDCFMAGGTSRRDHSEVGSSFVHFNYTPHQDKATPSLIGDVPRGVMLDQEPVFLGGQGGLVGPSVIEYGTITAAGTVCRKDVTEPGILVFGPTDPRRGEIPYNPAIFGDISRILRNNFVYLGNLKALYHWYREARSVFLDQTPYGASCRKKAMFRIAEMTKERLNRVSGLSEKVAESFDAASQKADGKLPEIPYSLHREFVDRWESRHGLFDIESPGDADTANMDSFIEELQGGEKDLPFTEIIASLSSQAKAAGTTWLQSIVDDTVSSLKITTD